MRRTRLILTTALMSLTISTFGFSQTTNATLGGTVTDASGALIPGVTVTVTNTGTGLVQTYLTNEAGVYQFASLQTGTYKVDVELTGFQKIVINNLPLGIGDRARQNFTLKVAQQSTQVDVSYDANTELKSTTASVGTVLSQSQLTDLPLGSRNIQALIGLSAGTGPQGDDGTISGNFAGGRISAVNVTRDGFVNSDGRYTHGEFAQTYTSPDLVEEVKIITSSVDAENGRGSGQVQMATRSGTNSYRGSVFYTNRNSMFDANTWANNLTGLTKDFENRNQFGGRIGGPIIKNKTFFFFLIDEQRDVQKTSVVGTVLTDAARQGFFRYYSGLTNQNAAQTNPSVNLDGSPRNGAPLCFNLFNNIAPSTTCDGTPGTPRDLNRNSIHPFVTNVVLANMPHPNDFTVGDGLNTAGIRFTRRVYGMDVADGNSNDQNNRDQFNVRIDHNFSANHKLSGVWTQERSIDHSTQAGLRSWPNGFDGGHNKWPRQYTLSFVSTISPTMLNEFRFGLRRSAIASWSPSNVGKALDGTGAPNALGAEAAKYIQSVNNIPIYIGAASLGFAGFMNQTGGFAQNRSSRSPLWQYGDNFSWSRGKHALKMGVEFRRDQSTGWNDNNMQPLATLGTATCAGCGIPAAAINSLPGISTNNTLAGNLLSQMAGAVSSVAEGFDIPDATATQFLGYADGYVSHDRDWHSNEASLFFKDDWKFSKNFTMNLGIHWEYFGVPYEGKGRAGRAVGSNETGACGISCGSLTAFQFVGKNSPNPDQLLYNNDFNNFAPSVGISYSLPWFGEGKTVIRAGYGWSYTGGALKSANTIVDAIAGSSPGATLINAGAGISWTPSTYANLSTISLPIPQSPATGAATVPVLSPVPINNHASTLAVYSTNRINPYIQNFNLEIQRELSKTLTVSVSYVGSTGTHLNGGQNLNAIDITKLVINGETFLDAFNTTRDGGNSPFFATLLAGSSVPNSAALRASTTYDPAIVADTPGTLAAALSTNNQGSLYAANVGHNFFQRNPQFSTVNYYDNSFSSSYHSLQVEVTKRMSQGLTSQFTYTFSKTLDVSDGDAIYAPRDINNVSMDRSRAGFDRTHVISANSTYALPFGGNRAFLADAPGWAKKVVENWTMGGILSYSSGSPLTITGNSGTTWNGGPGNVQLVGDFPGINPTTVTSGVGLQYFSGILTNQADTTNALVSGSGNTSPYTGKMITDLNGQPIFVNAQAGTVGNLSKNTFDGPISVGLDMNLIKRVKISETKEFELRVDTVNILNHANLGSPSTNINAATFGTITTSSGARRFTFSTRLSF